MDLVSLCFSVCAMMVCLAGAAQLSSMVNSCPCPEIPPWSLTKPPQQTCFQIGSPFRYTCIDDYLRKVGTSNLIKCKEDEGAPSWTKPTLECIPDPRKTTTRRTMTTGKTISTTQMMQSARTVPEEGNITETTTQETVTQTTGITKMIQNSTLSSRAANNSISPSISQIELLKTTTVATVSTLILVIVFSLGIVFLLYRRKSKRRVPVSTEDELDEVKYINLAPLGVD